MSDDFNKTLNLPVTDFPMRAGLPQKEPVWLEQFEQKKLYEGLLQKNAGKPLFILHDGPPYANGDIHLGTALNKVLKDFIVRYKNMSGFQSPYVPGWDTHGLPTELKARKKAGIDNNSAISDVELRKLCRDFALSYLEDQRRSFKRLGVIGEWDKPYITLTPDFEAKQIEVFAEMASKNYIYKGLKPVYWCSDCGTALAEAEIEYQEDPCFSIFVKFPLIEDGGKLRALGAELAKTYFVIWTTTTWTLPGNVAISVGPEFSYALVQAGGEYYVMAQARVESTMQSAGIEDYQVLGTLQGNELEHMRTAHPFLERESLVIVGDHVTLESGTGCVHTAPGHGVEDYVVCQNYPELPILVPVDSQGKMTAEAGADVAGLTTEEANRVIGKQLQATGKMLAGERIVHTYPHCWRCKNPVLFRATDQWFCSIADFKQAAIDAAEQVEWYPEWGKDRMQSMIRERRDWCISRQRKWGVPIPVFYCKQCGKEHISREAMMAVADLFRAEGSDAWFTHPAAEILPEGTCCGACGGTEFEKEKDIMDVWFDSGSSHAAVLEQRDYLRFPADVYLEGADQFRGWFQSSLLTAVATKGTSPFKAAIAHGWVVDGDGRKMSKSLGNGIEPEEIVAQYGADILRLWVASSDYHADIRISKDILKQLSEIYRKIRNTARFILGNLADFNPDTDAVPLDKLRSIDRWAMMRLDELITKTRASYEKYEYHTIFHAVHNFCVLDMSNFYLDVLKDRLYVEKASSETRRAAQTVIYRVLDVMTRLIAPLLSFTAEEIWCYMPHHADADARFVAYNDMPSLSGLQEDDAFLNYWERLHAVREDVQKALELARTAKVIGASLEAQVLLHAQGDLHDFLEQALSQLPEVLIVSQVSLETGEGAFKGELEGLSVTVKPASGAKCERCWMYSETVGQDRGQPTLCARCASILKGE